MVLFRIKSTLAMAAGLPVIVNGSVRVNAHPPVGCVELTAKGVKLVNKLVRSTTLVRLPPPAPANWEPCEG
jgi:hypothetical protein